MTTYVLQSVAGIVLCIGLMVVMVTVLTLLGVL